MILGIFQILLLLLFLAALEAAGEAVKRLPVRLTFYWVLTVIAAFRVRSWLAADPESTSRIAVAVTTWLILPVIGGVMPVIWLAYRAKNLPPTWREEA